MKIMSINAGSSSLKFSLFEMENKELIASGLFEKVTIPGSFYTIKYNGEKFSEEIEMPNHTVAVKILLDRLVKNGIINSLDEISAIGHRLVHGADKYNQSVIITDEVVEDLKKFSPLAPLHNPANILGIEAVKDVLPNVPMVGVFDTAFHQTMDQATYMYPLPLSWYEKHKVRKYGFHGTSHKYITLQMKEKLAKEDVNLIVCHVGSGSSIACIKDGKSYDTTMGLTPLPGLMMGTRSGDIDPSIIEYVSKESNSTMEEIGNLLNKKSGFLGVCGQADCRDVEDLMASGDENAKLAYEMYTDRVAKYIAEYYLKLEGNVDAIVFTAGIGENGPMFRSLVLKKLNALGIYENEETNSKIAGFLSVQEGKISSEESSVDVYVLPTNEELMIVKDTYELVK